ncbi:MAG: PEP/pyruvate-binding domain-containing protein [Desulfobacteraceae bacterium]|nr:PEP/pyruvate-binding domain-containing protein [Desulfobacteraceae bacterium]
MALHSNVSTGWESLDIIIDHLRRGDNVVWQVDAIDDYQRRVTTFVNSALADGERVVYFRFARHVALLEERKNLTIYRLNVEKGFESFSSQVHSIITQEGKNVCYVFDSLSDLLHVWATDLMIGDFFSITCPYLYELNTIAYFAILRNRHSFKAIARIREITQVLIDVYNYKGQVCIHPVKVQHRYSPTMFFPHIKQKSNLQPVINSVDATELFTHLSSHKTGVAQRHLDYWDRLFIEARNLYESEARPEEKQDMVEQLSRLLLTRNKKILSLIREHMTLDDLLKIKERLIGSGFIGGKSVGMLLARKILSDDTTFDWADVLEHHDSFYIGSDVFYSYIVQNGWWKLFMAHKTREGYFDQAAELRERMLTGVFPDEVTEQFQLMLEHFGQSPIIVRSSSLLEDAFGSAFAGKYESCFCVNQGSPEKRYEKFEEAVRHIFASAMNEDALAYRLQRGLDQMDERMALLVQRVSGSYHKDYFFPEMAGVGLSHNPFVWKKGMDPKAGMLRLVYGLGTRAVDRVGNDYPRIIAVDDPLVKPLAGMKDIRRFSQHSVDLLNLEENRIESASFESLLEKNVPARIDLLTIRDTEAIQALRDMGRSEKDQRILTFDPFLSSTSFIDVMRSMLSRLEKKYRHPVDIEFTVNFNQANDIQINLLQCRPFQTIGMGGRRPLPESIRDQDIVIHMNGHFMGGNIAQPISMVILVDSEPYTRLSLSEKYSVAHLIGKLNRTIADREKNPTLLLGPGRWGTHTPAMGVSVKFSEINHIAAMAEISYRDGNLIPDLSFGTHFFHDLIETRIFYMAIYSEQSEVIFNRQWFIDQPNLLEALSPVDGHLAHVVKVADTREAGLIIHSDVASQQVMCFLSQEKGKD